MLMKLCSHVNHDPITWYLFPSRAYVEEIAADENSWGGGRVGLFTKIVLACVAGVLRGQVVKRYKLVLVYPTSHVWCRVILDDGGRQVDGDKKNMNFFLTVERKALQAAEAVTVVDKIVFRTCKEAWHLCNNENNMGGDINTCHF